MKLRYKLMIIILTILTIGIFLIAFKHNKNNEIKQNLSSSKTKINIKKLSFALGENNIIKADATYTKIKFYFKDKKAINKDALDKMKEISGIIISSESIILLVGNQAKDILTEWNKFNN